MDHVLWCAVALVLLLYYCNQDKDIQKQLCELTINRSSSIFLPNSGETGLRKQLAVLRRILSSDSTRVPPLSLAHTQKRGASAPRPQPTLCSDSGQEHWVLGFTNSQDSLGTTRPRSPGRHRPPPCLPQHLTLHKCCTRLLWAMLQALSHCNRFP